eukprot:s2179_g13.t1
MKRQNLSDLTGESSERLQVDSNLRTVTIVGVNWPRAVPATCAWAGGLRMPVSEQHDVPAAAELGNSEVLVDVRCPLPPEILGAPLLSSRVYILVFRMAMEHRCLPCLCHSGHALNSLTLGPHEAAAGLISVSPKLLARTRGQSVTLQASGLPAAAKAWCLLDMESEDVPVVVEAENCGKALCESGGYIGSNVEADAEKASPVGLRHNSKSSVTAGIRRSDSSYALLLRLEEAGAEWRDVEGFSDAESPKQSILNDENNGRSLSPSKRWETDRDRFMQITHLHQAPTFPRILCVSRRYLRKNKYVDITGEYHLDLIQDYGGAPVILPRTAKTIQQLCEYLPMDGLVIAEGNDLSDDILLKYGCNVPERLTGEAAKKFASDTEMDVPKDELEFALMRFALAAGVPILTFCRGSQMLNCMRGGTLVGDIEHPIEVKPNTPLAEWFGDSLGEDGNDGKTLMVNSYHHQASKDLGWSLVPMAHSPDGLIEAFYDPRYDPKKGQFVVGLQFHPERMLGDYPGCARCYESFLEACRAYKDAQDASAPTLDPCASEAAQGEILDIEGPYPFFGLAANRPKDSDSWWSLTQIRPKSNYGESLEVSKARVRSSSIQCLLKDVNATLQKLRGAASQKVYLSVSFHENLDWVLPLPTELSVEVVDPPDVVTWTPHVAAGDMLSATQPLEVLIQVPGETTVMSTYNHWYCAWRSTEEANYNFFASSRLMYLNTSFVVCPLNFANYKNFAAVSRATAFQLYYALSHVPLGVNETGMVESSGLVSSPIRLLLPFGVAFGAEQRIFWVDDLISQTKVESKLWMMTGEDASFGNRKIRYDDEAYCVEAYGTVNPTICKPSYLINGWNTTDGTSLADRTQLSVAYDPAGEGDGEHVVGPVVDKTNNRVYYITPTCADSSRRLGRRLTVWKVKYLLDNQIVPDGTVADPLQCANESYVFAVNRYDVDTAKFSLIYVASRANFPAPDKWTAFSWKLAFDESKQRLYWWYYAGSCAVVRA